MGESGSAVGSPGWLAESGATATNQSRASND